MPLFHPSFILPKRDAESSSSREPLVVHDPHHPPFQEIIHPHSSIVPRRDETPVSNDTSLPEQETEEDDTPLYLQRTQLTPKDVMVNKNNILSREGFDDTHTHLTRMTSSSSYDTVRTGSSRSKQVFSEIVSQIRPQLSTIAQAFEAAISNQLDEVHS